MEGVPVYVEEVSKYMIDQKKLAIFVGAFLIAFVVRLLKDDVHGPSIDKRWRMALVWILGVCQFGLNLALSMSWGQAAEYAAISAVLAISGHETIIEWWRSGKELPLPGLMKKPELPPKPTLVPVEPPKPKHDETPPPPPEAA